MSPLRHSAGPASQLSIPGVVVLTATWSARTSRRAALDAGVGDDEAPSSTSPRPGSLERAGVLVARKRADSTGEPARS
jgi:hypothetical protein